MEKTLLHTTFPNTLQRVPLSLGCHTYSVISYHHHVLLQVSLCSGGTSLQKLMTHHEVWIVFPQKKTVYGVKRSDAETPVLLPRWGTTGQMFSTTQWQDFTACIRRADSGLGSPCCSSFKNRLPLKSRHCHVFPKPSHYARKEQERKELEQVDLAVVSLQQLWPTKTTS